MNSITNIQAFDHLSNYAAAGPDGFPAVLLKMCKNELAEPLELIFRESLDSGTIPEIWKEAFIFPIHKGGDLEVNEKLNDAQHGFRQRRSCLSQLLQHHEKLLELMEDGDNVDVVYLDFAKAFDKVDHGLLLRKMRKIGITGKIGKWIMNFLLERFQQVVVTNQKSKKSSVISGVPQGSVLGPLLFLIMINDINHNIESNVSLFADDTRISSRIGSEDCVERFQEDLEKLYEWQDKNNMKFNGSKFELMRYGAKEQLKNNTVYFTPEHENVIEEKDDIKDLGVILSSDMKFSKHVEKVIATVNKKMGWIFRTFRCREVMFMKVMWKQLLQPHVDYCSQLYFTGESSNLSKIENLQRTFTRKIYKMDNLSYWERLKTLKLYSQERRMERYRILYTWKMLEGLVPNCGIQARNSERLGRFCEIPPINGKSSQKMKSLKEKSFNTNGQCCSIQYQRISEIYQNVQWKISK